MTPASRDDFIKAILRSRLLEKAHLEERVREFLKERGKEDSSAEQFARFLIAGKDLSKYQAERLLAGRTEGFFLGQCKILDRLGAGGMGAVYLAEQTKLGGRKVAIKILPAQHAKDPKYLARFHREACAVAELKHPNVVQIYDVGQEGETHYLIMELVHGATLEKRVDQEGPLAIAESVEAIEQVARGLAHAHKHGIVHRDIKPSNLMLEGQTVKILDLGLAKKTGSGTLTQDHKGMGTPYYMSPEQFRDARSADARCDLYSLGCTWYNLLTGQVPFPDVPALGQAVAHLKDTPEPIAKLRPAVPQGISLMADKLMAKDPGERFQTAEELLAAISDWRATGECPGDVSAPAKPKDLPGPVAKPTPKPGRTTSSLHPADAEAQQTLIHTPVTGIPTLVLYLIPVMAALVLGGVYIGIRALGDRWSPQEPVVVDLKSPPQEKNLETKSKPVQPPEKPTEEKKAQKRGESKDKQEPPKVVKTDFKKPSGPAPVTPKLEPRIAEVKKRSPKVWVVGSSINSSRFSASLATQIVSLAASPWHGPLRSLTTFLATGNQAPTLEAAWNWAEDGDRIELTHRGPLEVGQLYAADKRLTLAGIGGKRPVVVWKVPSAPQVGKGLWQIHQGSLSLENLDLYVDVRKRKGDDGEIVLCELLQADFFLRDASVTVVRGAAQGGAPVTVAKVLRQREWDRKARGNPPAPLKVDFRNSMIRGPNTTLYMDSRQADVRFENVIVASPGTVVHFFHTQKRLYMHDELRLEMANCTFDAEGPMVTVDCRPFDLVPTPLDLRVHGTFLAAKGTFKPPVLLWQSPIQDTVLSSVLRWRGKGNGYFQRGDCLQAMVQGKLNVYVESPADWTRVGLGEEAGSRELTKVPVQLGPPWDQRQPSHYALALPKGFTPQPLGAFTQKFTVPRPFKMK